MSLGLFRFLMVEMACPIGSHHGFINLNGKILDNTKYNPAGSPFIMRFAPRGTPITLIDRTNVIQEDPNNTLSYKTATYIIDSVQICKPSTPATGSYSLYGTNIDQNIATLVFRFTQQVQSASSSIPYAILLVLPIFLGNEYRNSQYLTQLVISRDTYTSMQTLFKNQPSFGYPICIDTQSTNEKSTSLNLMIYTFPKGINLSNDNWTAILKKLPNTIVPILSFNNISIIQTYDDKRRALSSGPIASSIPIEAAPMSPTDTVTTNLITYYPADIQAHKFKYATNRNLPVSQYQCQPFDELKNLQTDPGGVQRVSLKEVIKSTEDASLVGMSISVTDLWLAIGPIIVIVGIIIGMTIYFYIAYAKAEPLPPGAPVPVPASGSASGSAPS
jgi:hypothetical protein